MKVSNRANEKWVYDPAEHDNVAFEDLPADWHCPVCGVGKEDFESAYN